MKQDKEKEKEKERERERERETNQLSRYHEEGTNKHFFLDPGLF